MLPVSAGTYLQQGDKVYYGDKVDLTGVYGWQCTVAHWDPGTNNLQPPSQIRDVCSFSENIEITPDRFPAGSWYKWGGSISKGENDLAFTVVGHPPVPTPTPVVVNLTTPPTVSPITALSTVIQVTLQPTSVPVTTPTSVFSAATEVFLPAATPADAPQSFVPPNLPPIPIMIIMILVGGAVLYWWIQGTM